MNLGEGAAGRFAINSSGGTIDVYSDDETLHGVGLTGQYVAFLHTSFPTYGYVDASALSDAYTHNFGTYGTVNGNETYIVELNKECSCNIPQYDANTITSLAAGTKILVNTMDCFSSSEMWDIYIYGFYGYYDGSVSEGWQTTPSWSDAWTLDTGIRTASGEGLWGIKLASY